MKKKNKYINKMTDKDLQELKDGLWTKLIFGKDITYFEEGQSNLEKRYNREQKAIKKSSAEIIKANNKLKLEQGDRIYLEFHSVGFVNRIKKWYYGEKKFNKLLLEKRNNNA
jgi:hypothetical protein